MEGIRAEMSQRGKNCSRDAAGLPEAEAGSALQRDAAAAYAHPEVPSLPQHERLSQAGSLSSLGTLRPREARGSVLREDSAGTRAGPGR